VRVDHKRASLDLISAVTTRGELRWMVLDGAVKAPSLLRLLDGLVLDAEQKVSLILDRLPVHRSTKPRGWLAGWGGPRSSCSTCLATAPSATRVRGSAAT
jgi:hypothetical protein